jgi:hypothetical protein
MTVTTPARVSEAAIASLAAELADITAEAFDTGQVDVRRGATFAAAAVLGCSVGAVRDAVNDAFEGGASGAVSSLVASLGALAAAV